MREILIEQARRKGSLKRGGESRRVELVDGLALIEPPACDLLVLDEAIQELQGEKPHLAEVVMLRYFTGLSVQETADVVGRSVSTVVREWRFARAWLAGRLGEGMPSDEEETADGRNLPVQEAARSHRAVVPRSIRREPETDRRPSG